jgi:hypothetical protein
VSGTWNVVNGAAQNTSSATTYPYIWLGVADDDQELRYTYSFDSVTSGEPALTTVVRWEASTNKQLRVVFFSNMAGVYNYNGASWSMLAENTSVTSSIGTKYRVRIVLDGTTLKVYRSTGGGLETLIFNLTGVPTYNGAGIHFIVNPNMVASIDNVMMLADDLAQTTTFTVASNNELSTMADYNGSNTFAYDAWGRMTSKTRSGVSATYDYGYGQRLTKVISTYSDEPSITYTYGGDRKLRKQDVTNGETTWYNYEQGMNVINEETGTTGGTGNLTRFFVPGLADVTGSVPASGSYNNYLLLNSEMPSAAYDGSKVKQASMHYAPLTEPTILGYASIGSSEQSVRARLDKISGGVSRIERGDYWDKVSLNGEFEFKVDPGRPSVVDIYWSSYKDCLCTEAKFLQIVDDRGPLGIHTWHIDTGSWYRHQYRIRDVQFMTDAPNTGAGPGWQKFETCLICTSGDDARKNYGCITWNVYTHPNWPWNHPETTVDRAEGKYAPIAPSRMFRFLTSLT